MNQPAGKPLIFGGLTQCELDKAYDQDAWASNAAEVQGRIIVRSDDVARQTPPQSRRYGRAEQQVIDIFAPEVARNAPVFILIHGGAWRLAMRQAFYGAAPVLTTAGGILAVVGFACLPDVSMIGMADQIHQAVTWIAGEIGAFGGDRRNLHLVGHSSGAHLAAVALSSGLPAAPALRGGTLISGLYDLEPVLLSSRRHYIDLADDETIALSPIHRPNDFAGVTSIWWGSQESPEFKRQSQCLATALDGAGKLGPSGMLAGRNHFEMLEEIENPDSPIVKTMLAAAGR
jgi:arylformamidase